MARFGEKGIKRKTRLLTRIPPPPLKVDLHNTIYRRNLSAASFVQTRICREHLCI